VVEESVIAMAELLDSSNDDVSHIRVSVFSTKLKRLSSVRGSGGGRVKSVEERSVIGIDASAISSPAIAEGKRADS